MEVEWLYTADIPFSDEVIREKRTGIVIGTIRQFFTNYFLVTRNGAIEYIPVDECAILKERKLSKEASLELQEHNIIHNAEGE